MSRRIDGAENFANSRTNGDMVGIFAVSAVALTIGIGGGVGIQNAIESYGGFDASDFIGAGVGAFLAALGIAYLGSFATHSAARSGYLNGAWREQDGNH